MNNTLEFSTPSASAERLAQCLERGPLSFSQEGVWLFDHFAGADQAYVVPSTTRIEGELDLECLQTSLRALVARHPALRTLFVDGPGGPEQCVLDPAAGAASFELERAALTTADVAAPSLTELIAQGVERPFRIAHELPFRAACIELGDGSWLLALRAHHLVVDGTSMGIMHRELAEVYAAGGDASGLPRLAGDTTLAFAKRQRELEAAGAWEGHRRYWQQELSGVEDLRIVHDRPRPLRSDFVAATLEVPIDSGLVAGLHELARGAGSTHFRAWLAVFQALLARLQGSCDFAVGIPVAGRRDPRLRDVIGDFINTLAIRMPQQAGSGGFEELLRATDATVTRALEHAEYPFEKVVAGVAVERSAERNPVYQAYFALHNLQDRAAVMLPGLKCSALRLPRRRATLDLSLGIEEHAQGATAIWQYRADLFDADVIERMAQQMSLLLHAILGAPAAPLDSLPLLDAEQRARMLETGSGAAVREPWVGVPQAFAQQALRSPDAVALRWRGQDLSYAELDSRARRWAAALRSQGIAPGSLVAVCMPRSFGEVAALLAVLKTGAAFLPLDPDSPQARLRDLLDEARPAAVLAHPELCETLRNAVGGAAPVLAVPEDACGGIDASAQDDADPGPGELAYVIFTSGSTGRPKAAQIEHGSLGHCVAWFRDLLSMRESDAMLHNASGIFDTSMTSLFAPLACGARVVLADSEAQKDMERLHRLMLDEDVSLAQSVPSLLRPLVEQAAPRYPGRLRYLASAGEALDPALARRFREVFTQSRLGNLYGPTEATVYCTACEVEDAQLHGSSIPIGSPIAGARVLVLNSAMQLQPIGAVGEIHVGGVGVARGYLGRADLTAQRFVDDPFQPGQRLYRTGDLGRWRADGKLEFVGRRDHQIKLRGVRIELGEVEAALLALDGVGAAVAMPAGDEPSTRRLVAFVRCAHRDAQALRDALRSRLPTYMVPSSLVFVDEFARLPSGKLDRRALEALARDQAQAEHMPQAARSALEQGLVEIWRAVLRRQHIGVHDDFFTLGGSSLQATQVLSQIRAALGVRLELRVLFEQPTIAGLGAEIERSIGSANPAKAVIPTLSRDGALLVSSSQRRMWLEYQIDPQGAAYNVHCALRMRGSLDRAALERALDGLVRRHEAFRTRFGFEFGEPVARVGAPAPVQLECLDVSGTPQQVAKRLAAHAAQPFDLERGPLHRFVLARAGVDEHWLVLVLHHIITDAWSNEIVLAELAALYSSALRGAAPQLAPKPIDFADFAAWQRSHVDEDLLRPQRAYWLDRLDGMVPLSLPTDTGRSTRSGSHGDVVQIALSDAWVDGLQRRSAELGSTPFMVLLAVFQSLLARWCAQDDIAVGVPIAGRTSVESEGVVGSLVNTLVLRSRVDGARSLREFVQSEVRPAVLGAFTHQDLPYDQLINRLRERGGPGSNPGVRVLFNILNQPSGPLHFEGLQVEREFLPVEATQFDLGVGFDFVGFKSLRLGFSTELFERASIEGLGELFLHGLDRALGDPGLPLRALWSVPPAQLSRLRRWNAPRPSAAAKPAPNLPALLAASRGLDGEAIRDAAGRVLSYAELWARVDGLSARLVRLGARRGTLVGLGLPRDAELLVAQLATLQAGAAYVPLDPNYPPARLRDMIDDAGLLVLLTHSELRDVWEPTGVPLLELDRLPDDEPEALAGAEAQAQDAPIAEDPAYVIYTSGSTGKPKGVVVPHGAVVNFLVSMQREPGMGPGDVVLAVTTLSFDIAVLELLLPVSVGARIALASHEQASDGRALLARLQAERATVMQATPASWRMLIDAGWRGSEGFKALVGGEALGRDLADSLLERCDELWNMYGPTETTVWSTCWRVQASPAPIRIGTPIANTQVHVLDSDGQPCPIGFSGEILIGGDGVTSGYLHRGELTAERFVPDPWRGVPGARMYRTGDRGRWGHDGLLEHQGRLDFQVKLRGFRIELGEIEAHLQSHPEVGDCLTMVREDIPGDPRLTAYIVPTAADIAVATLRDWLRARLPGYMVPQQFVVLAELPRLPNGKIDRKSLPVPRHDAAAHTMAGGDVAVTPAEQALARIWIEVLGTQNIRRTDNFFDLGGHSLLANRVVVDFERLTGQRLSLRRLVHENLSQLVAGVSMPSASPQTAAHASVATGFWSRLGRQLRLGKG